MFCCFVLRYHENYAIVVNRIEKKKGIRDLVNLCLDKHRTWERKETKMKIAICNSHKLFNYTTICNIFIRFLFSCIFFSLSVSCIWWNMNAHLHSSPFFHPTKFQAVPESVLQWILLLFGFLSCLSLCVCVYLLCGFMKKILLLLNFLVILIYIK